jgi:hypothetical protein
MITKERTDNSKMTADESPVKGRIDDEKIGPAQDDIDKIGDLLVD